MNLRKKKQPKKMTQAIFVIDESGSMMSARKETIDGINEQLQELRKNKDVKTNVTIIKFNSEVNPVVINKDVAEVQDLSNDTYKPDGMTALYDAIGHAVETERGTQYDTKDVTRLLVIVTDGQENSSQKYSRFNNGQQDIKKLLDEIDQDDSWTTTFLGANINLEDVHQNLGIAKSNIAMYSSTAEGTKNAFTAMTKSTCNYLNTRATLSAENLSAIKTKFYNSEEEIKSVE